jgi:hypothetical protein
LKKAQRGAFGTGDDIRLDRIHIEPEQVSRLTAYQRLLVSGIDDRVTVAR